MSVFIWTECFGCPLIGSIAIRSFLHHNPRHMLNVFAYKDDIRLLPSSDRVLYHTFPMHSRVGDCMQLFLSNISEEFCLSEGSIKNHFQHGHRGTSAVWAYILKRFSNYDSLIHFDSDIIFTGPAIELLLEKADDFDLIGQCRPYKNNMCGNDSVRSKPDLVQTCCFLFKPVFSPSIYRLPQKALAKAIQGKFRVSGHSLLDFFDQISFEPLRCGAQIHHMTVDDFGGIDMHGSRSSAFSSMNNYSTDFKIDVGRFLIHFSAVGSGYNIWKNGASSGSSSYDNYALSRFLLYMHCFYPEFRSSEKFDISINKQLIDYIRDNKSLSFLYS